MTFICLPRAILIAAIFSLTASCGRTGEIKPERRDISEYVFAPGTLEPEYVYHLTAQTDGVIISLSVQEGDSVRNGQLLGVIDNKPNAISSHSSRQLLSLAELQASKHGPLLRQAERNISLLREKMGQDSMQWRRYENLHVAASVPKVELERNRLAYESSKTAYENAMLGYNLQKQEAEQRAITQRAQQEITQVSALFNEIRAAPGGRVYRLLKERGDFVRRGELIGIVGDAGRMRARLNVDESNIARIRKGQTVEIRLNTDRERTLKAVITDIAPTFDEATQSFVCKASLLTQPEFRVYGTQLQANILVNEKKNALVIPRSAYNYNNQVRVKGKGTVSFTPGFISTEWVEVLEGLGENDVLETK